MAEAATAQTSSAGRHKRHLRNYLLDTRFQLRYAGYLVGIALVVSAALGIILWRTSKAVIAQSHKAVQQGEQVVERGREVLAESRKVSAVVEMNIVKDPVYQDNPELLAAFKADRGSLEDRLQAQQKVLEAQATALKEQARDLARKQRTMWITLVVALSALVLIIGLVGIVVTHKVAGPIYKMKRLIREVRDGRLEVPGRLRKGDELVDFFQAYNEMVRNLRARQEHEIALLDAAIGKMEAKVDPEELQPVREVRDEMKQSLET